MMISKFSISAILCILLHFGTAQYHIWPNERESIFNKTLYILKSVHIGVNSSNFKNTSDRLGIEMATLISHIHGLSMFNFYDRSSTRMSNAVDYMAFQEDNKTIIDAVDQVFNAKSLFVDYYTNYFQFYVNLEDIDTMMKSALELDDEKSFEYSESMTTFYKLYINKYRNRKTISEFKIRTPELFLAILLKYNLRNEWHTFIMIVIAYKLKSLEAGDNKYIQQFHRLKEGLLKKIKMHEAEYVEAIYRIIVP